MTIIVNTPDTVAVQTIVNQSNTIVGAAQVGSIAPNKFVFFAAFDGTNNNKDDVRDANGNLRLTGDPQDTNVAQLFKQADQPNNPNLVARYFAGPGGEPTNSNGLLTAIDANAYIQASAERAYNQFASEASKKENWGQTPMNENLGRTKIGVRLQLNSKYRKRRIGQRCQNRQCRHIKSRLWRNRSHLPGLPRRLPGQTVTVNRY